MVATQPFELPGGCEDPRVVQVGGTYYMTYTGYDGTSARLCLATSRDLLRWTKHGPLFPNFRTRTVGQAVEQVRRDPHHAAGRQLHTCTSATRTSTTPCRPTSSTGRPGRWTSR